MVTNEVKIGKIEQSKKWDQNICKEIFFNKYMINGEKSEDEVFSGIAIEIASAEKTNHNINKYEQEFYDIISSGYFLPGGRIIANARPNSRMKNYNNCFTIGLPDSIGNENSNEGIYDSLKEDAIISKMGGGVGFDISNIRPENSELSKGGVASGPLSFLTIFNQSALTIQTGGNRRAAHICLMDVSHPDIEKFITYKQGNNKLSQFNLSVKITDKFINAVKNNYKWDLVFNEKVYKTIDARYLYDLIALNAYKHNEPGIFNVDIVNKYNNGWYGFKINTVNPCGEIVMPEYFLCDLGAINLSKFVINQFSNNPVFDFGKFEKTIYLGVRFLDNVLDVCDYPLEKIRINSMNWRKIGLGFTGFADMLAMMKIQYGSKESKKFTNELAEFFRNESYESSIRIAREKGSFIKCDGDKLVFSKFIQGLPKELICSIKNGYLRNIGINTCAPTGTISLSLGENCSSGIEPIFELEYDRNIRIDKNDKFKKEKVYDYAWIKYNEFKINNQICNNDIPEYFVTTKNIDPFDSIDIQSIWQKYIDHSISKTLNLPQNLSFDEYKNLFMYAYEKELKGFTTFNPNGSMKGILEYNNPKNNDLDKNKPSYIQRINILERPKELECDIHLVTFDNLKHIILVGILNGSLYEIFVDKENNSLYDINSYTNGKIIKEGKGIYNLYCDNLKIISNISDTFDSVYGSLTRLISLSLRCGTPLQKIVNQLSKSKSFTTFDKVVMRVLKKYIQDGEKVMTDDICINCNGELIYISGCVTCKDCGWSKCG